MKRKRILSLLLAAVLLLGLLCACGKQPASPTAELTAAEGPATLQSNEPPEPRYAYVPEFYAAPKEIKNISVMDCADDLAYFAAELEDGAETQIQTMKDENGNDYQQEISVPTTRPAVFTLDLKTGEIAELKSFPFPKAEEGWEDGRSHIECVYAMEDGTAWVGLYCQPVRYNLPEDFDPQTDRKFMYAEYGKECDLLIHVSPDGTELGQIECDGVFPFEAAFDKAGRVYLSVNETVFVYDADCNPLFTLDNPDHGSVCRLGGDRVALNCTVTDPLDQTTVTELRTIDAEQRAFGETIRLERTFFDILPGNDEYLFYYKSNNDVYAYPTDSEDRPCVLNWIDCDIEPIYVSNVCMRPNGNVFALYHKFKQGTTDYQLVALRMEDVSDRPEKTVLQLAGYEISTSFGESVVEFNRTSETCRICVTDYAKVSATPESGLLLLNTQIMAGNVPDLFLTSGLPVSQLAARGLLADLYPLIDSGANGITRDSLMQPVLKALETDGKLYQIPYSFGVKTAFGLERIVGGYDRWDFAAVQDALSRLPDPEATVFKKSTTKATALEDCLNVNLSSFTDWTTGTCSFESDAFLTLLDFVNSFPAEYDKENEESPIRMDMVNLVRGGQLLGTADLDSFTSFMHTCLLYTEPILFVGYPNGGINNGSCFTLDSGKPMAISASCRDAKGAWDFISHFLTEEYQLNEDNRFNGFSMNQAVFDASAKKMTEFYYRYDENGAIIRDRSGKPEQFTWATIFVEDIYPSGFRLDGDDGELVARISPRDKTAVEVYRLTDEQIATVRELIEATTVILSEETSLNDIIIEECNPFFAGEKDARATASVIQSRANIYIAENS